MTSHLLSGLPALEQTHRNGRIVKDRDRAVVIGASIAGLCAARALSDHFREVILVERDTLVDTPEQRRGVPQGHHAHGLLAGGLKAVKALFPGLPDELESAGAVRCNVTRDSYWFFEGREHLRFESDLEAFGLSRPLLEGTIRKRVREIANVHFCDGCHVEGLLATFDNRCVIGIDLGDSAMPADLVVDATGRGSRSPEWLEALGYGKPEEERVEIDINYATRLFQRSRHDLNGAVFASIPPNPETKRGGVIAAQEGDVWIITLNAFGGTAVPTELNAFIESARNLPAPYIHEVISRAKPVGEPRATRFPANIRRRYEQMNSFPEGFLVMGDALSSFNPVYAQGMSVAALEAVELDMVLTEGGPRLAQRFFRRAAKIIDTPWRITTGNDLRISGIGGPQSLMARFMNWYIAELHVGARTDARMVTAFHRVTNLLAPPQSLLKPRLVARVLSKAWRRQVATNRASRLEAAARGAF
jgi:2-polyprenyl-6-methoxyphenol hydroxylase-like FAD-dependent oxidoreductase